MKQVLYGFGVAALLVLIGWQWQKNSSTKIENVTVTGPKPAEKVAYVTFDDGPSEITPGILDTLKKLSEEKLVIVVSHDRYFLNKVCTHIADIECLGTQNKGLSCYGRLD